MNTYTQLNNFTNIVFIRFQIVLNKFGTLDYVVEECMQ